MYVGLGKTTAWTDEANPPATTTDTTQLQEVIGYKKASTVSLCRPFVEGETTTLQTFTYGKNKYVLVPDEKAYTEKATLVYIESVIEGSELPVGSYRQVGVYTDVTPKTGVTKENLLPSEVVSAGVLQLFENRIMQNRTSTVTVRERFILNLSA